LSQLGWLALPAAHQAGASSSLLPKNGGAASNDIRMMIIGQEMQAQQLCKRQAANTLGSYVQILLQMDEICRRDTALHQSQATKPPSHSSANGRRYQEQCGFITWFRTSDS
jgi:hypothetical protein